MPVKASANQHSKKLLKWVDHARIVFGLNLIWLLPDHFSYCHYSLPWPLSASRVSPEIWLSGSDGPYHVPVDHLRKAFL